MAQRMVQNHSRHHFAQRMVRKMGRAQFAAQFTGLIARGTLTAYPSDFSHRWLESRYGPANSIAQTLNVI
jgi:hypothetical protein